MANNDEYDYLLEEYDGHIPGDFTSIDICCHVNHHPPTAEMRNDMIQQIMSCKDCTEDEKKQQIEDHKWYWDSDQYEPTIDLTDQTNLKKVSIGSGTDDIELPDCVEELKIYRHISIGLRHTADLPKLKKIFLSDSLDVGFPESISFQSSPLLQEVEIHCADLTVDMSHNPELKQFTIHGPSTVDLSQNHKLQQVTLYRTPEIPPGECTLSDNFDMENLKIETLEQK
jgi:hypothetical protein